MPVSGANDVVALDPVRREIVGLTAPLRVAAIWWTEEYSGWGEEFRWIPDGVTGMAKSEFLQNLKTARNLFFHRVHTDHPGLDPNTLQAQLARAAIWLSPSAVRGFDVRDFPELSSDTRSQLKENVERFLRIAKQVPPTKPATNEQVQEAMTAFLKVLEILNPYLVTGSEIKQVRAALEGIEFPKEVLTWEYELGADSTGDPAVWIWVFVDDASAEREDFSAVAARVRRKIQEAIFGSGIARVGPTSAFGLPANSEHCRAYVP